MTVLKHRNPCKQCPWRKLSLPGWLGASTPEEFITAALINEADMPCHKTVDYERDDWELQVMTTASHCAGSLVFMNNYCKLPRRKSLAKMVNSVKKSVTVFATPQEFLKHHRREK